MPCQSWFIILMPTASCKHRHGIVTINSRLEDSGDVYARELLETFALFRNLTTASTLSPCRRQGWPKNAADTSIWRSRAANEMSSSSARNACRALAGVSMARSICRTTRSSPRGTRRSSFTTGNTTSPWAASSRLRRISSTALPRTASMLSCRPCSARALCG